MGDKSGIEWTDATWNPIAGCSVVSPGCTNCYAMKMAARIEAMNAALGRKTHYAGLTKATKAGPVWTGRIAAAPADTMTLPLRWKRPRRIFVNSMADLFHEAVPDAWIDDVFAVMALAPQHTFMVLTKRSARMRAYCNGQWARREALGDLMKQTAPDRAGWYAPECDGKRAWLGMHVALPNVWLGVSVEDQRRADERIPDLLATPAAVRFLSCEPLLGPLDIGKWLHALDWVIAGGESGPGARPMHAHWARDLRDQCEAAAAPFFFKQWGEWAPGENVDRRAGIVETASLDGDRWSFDRENLSETDGHIDDEPDLYRVGKKAAGRLLDGVEHNAFPQVRG